MMRMDRKALIILIVAIGLMVVVTFAFALGKTNNTFKAQGWINCMPPLSESQQKICDEAEAAGYKMIAY